MNYDEISKMTGEKSSKAPEYKLNEISFNGKNGKFILREILKGKNSENKYDKKDLGSDLNCVFLKHRRILSSFKKVNGVNEIKSTTEHSHKDDFVYLFGAKEKGVASQLREKYAELKTRQIVYAYVPELKEVVRLVVKGSSLGSNQKSKDVLGYYDYLSSFEKDEHCWQHITKLVPVEETNDMGTYYAMSFIKSDKLDEEKIEKCVALIKEIHNYVTEYDAHYAEMNKKPVDQISEDVEANVDYDDDDYPTENINPEDIPF